jgi:hypothetical protein
MLNSETILSICLFLVKFEIICLYQICNNADMLRPCSSVTYLHVSVTNSG